MSNPNDYIMIPAGSSIDCRTLTTDCTSTITVVPNTGTICYTNWSAWTTGHTPEEQKEQACNILRQTLTNNPEYLADLYKVLDEFSIKNDVRDTLEE